jgi:hypothetical protein
MPETSEIRDVLSFPVGADGLFKDTGSYDEVKEEHVRQTFFQMFQYTDPWCGNPRIYDSEGNYDCGECNKFIQGGACLAVEGAISAKHGSCRHWENKDAGDSELKFARKISKEMADYGETPKAGFGCKRCEYHAAAKAEDSQGRAMFCKQGAFHVYSNACCALNDTPGMKTDFSESAIKSHGYDWKEA